MERNNKTLKYMNNENQRTEYYKGGQFVLKFRQSIGANEMDYARQHWADALRLHGDNGCALRNYPDVVMSATVPDDCNENVAQARRLLDEYMAKDGNAHWRIVSQAREINMSSPDSKGVINI